MRPKPHATYPSSAAWSRSLGLPYSTFQWTSKPSAPAYRMRRSPSSPIPVRSFGNLLGCWASGVFFMISGYFLIPRRYALSKGSSVHDLTRKSLARLQKIVFPTLFYCAACLLVSMYIYPLPEISLHEITGSRWVSSLLVYAASVLLVPVIVLARRQIGSKGLRLS
ncbi:MAG: acyltransferase family protein [Collinsella sp.]